MTTPSVPLKRKSRRGIPTPVAVLLALALGLLLAFGLWNLAGWGDQLAERLQDLVSAPAPRANTATPTLEPAVELPTETTTVATATPAAPPTATPAIIPTPTELPPTATVVAPATEARGTVVEGSPFSNLVLAQGIDDNYQPLSPGDTFEAGSKPVYLFFDYRGIQPGVSWGHVWLRGQEELGRTVDTWPDEWGSAGTAWVYYVPQDDYLPGPYQVQLLVDGAVVATADFTMR